MPFRFSLSLRRSKAFTLVEILITIILIGILAGSLLLVAGGAEDKTMANRILSDARTMKAAAILYNSDYNSWPIWVLAGATYKNMSGDGHAGVLPSTYVGQIPVRDKYWLGVVNDSTLTSGDVKAAVILYDKGLSVGVKQKMESMANEMRIYAMTNPMTKDFSQAHPYSTSDTNMMWFVMAKE